jgi:tripartite-type tricarboxylate transporter receptor subunit TctC
MKVLGRLIKILAACIAAAVIASAQAQQYPTKPLRLLVPFGAGSGGDITARAVAQKMSESMSQQVIVDNRPSAGGIVATELVATAEPDGHTLLLISNTQAVTAAMFKKLPYDTVKDFAMVSTIGGFSFGLLVAPESPIKSLHDLIAQAKAAPGKFNIGTINIGSTQYLSAELLKSMAGLDAAIVPFNGSTAVITALRGNSIQVAIENLAAVLGQVKAGALRAIAVTTATRYEYLPTVPTLAESGLPGFAVKSWNGIAVPAKTPKRVIERLEKEIHAAVNSPQIRQRFQELGVEPNPSSPESLHKLLVSEIAKWNSVIDTAHIPRQ